MGGNLVMEATCVTHVGVCVRDMEKSLAFYRDALGMKVLGEKTTNPSEGGQQGGPYKITDASAG